MTGTDDMLRARVCRAIREAYPDLAEDAVTDIGFDVRRLTALLQEKFGFDPETSERDARSVMLNALVPVNAGNAGWVELIDEEAETPLARGQLYLHDTTPDLVTGPPAGAITHLRMHDTVEELAPGPYRIRFEDSGEIRPVATVTDLRAPLGDMVALVFLDEGQPVTVMELSAGD